MKILNDFLPIVLFFVCYQLYDIYVATQVLMAVMVLQLGIMKLLGRPIEKMQWVILVLVLAFGALTLGLHDPQFIMWKPTIVNWLFAAALLFSEWFLARGLLRRMLAVVGEFPDQVISRLNWAWVIFLTLEGFLNLYVAYNYSEATWVNFKLFGLTLLSVLFMLAQGFYIARHMPQAAEVEAGRAGED
ncbi:MAG: septation protein A [Gammaproteobacteria bacterium]|nr:MAG: septation protein A [Gammaproteobacteria bacterium]